MPVSYNEYPKVYTPGESSTIWSSQVSQAIESFRSQLVTAGWTSSPRYVYTKLETVFDSSGFSPGLELFFAVFPLGWDPGVTDNAKLIVNAVPGGYTPPAGFEVYAVTGSIDKAVVHEQVVNAFLTFGPYMEIYTDPDNPLPNTYIQNSSTVTAGGGIPAIGLALNTTSSGWADGGYALTCVPNDDPENYVSLFIGQNRVPGIDPFKPFIFACKDVGEQPIEFTMTIGADRTPPVIYEFPKSDWVLAAGPSMCLLAQTSDGFNGQITLGCLDLPVSQSGISVAAFASLFGIAGAGTVGFRTGPTAQGVMYMQTNEIEYYGTNPGTPGPRAMGLWGPSGKWENGLAQISEPWVGLDANLPSVVPVVGRMPDVLLANGAFDAEDTPGFAFDNGGYRIWGDNVTANGAGQVGTIGVAIPGSVPSPGCP